MISWFWEGVLLYAERLVSDISEAFNVDKPLSWITSS